VRQLETYLGGMAVRQLPGNGEGGARNGGVTPVEAMPRWWTCSR